MRASSSFLLSLFALLIVGLFGWAVFAPKEDLSDRIQKTMKEQEKVADLSFKDVTFEEVLGGTKYWALEAMDALVNKSTGIASLKSSSGEFFKGGKATMRFLSPAALWDMKKKEILLDQPFGYDLALQGQVDELLKKTPLRDYSVFTLPQLAGQNSYWFRAKNLSWNLADQKLFCTGSILLNKGEVTGYAQKLTSDVAMEHVWLKGEPRLIIKMKDGTLATIEAQTFEINTPDNLILAYGSPVIYWGQALVRAERLAYHQKDRLLELAERVKIDYNDLRAWGDAGAYLLDEQTIALSGHAKAVQGDNNLTGDKVSVNLNQKKISVAGRGKVVISEEQLKNDDHTGEAENQAK